jgi:hypothetical protein
MGALAHLEVRSLKLPPIREGRLSQTIPAYCGGKPVTEVVPSFDMVNSQDGLTSARVDSS